MCLVLLSQIIDVDAESEPLCTDTDLNLRDRVLGEVEIGLLLSQRGPLWVNALKTVCPTRGFTVLFQAAGHDELIDILLNGWW